jgi:Zinc carboxypeptidase
MRFPLALCMVALFGNSYCQTGWSRYRVFTYNEAEVQRLSNSPLELFSDNVSLGETDMIVGPGQFKLLASLKLNVRWISELPDPRNWDQRPGSDDFHTNYLNYSDMIAQYEAWRVAYPDYIRRYPIATTWNGNTVWAYRFFNNLTGDRLVRQSFLITCGIHAREWISPAVGLHVMDKLIQSSFTRSGFTLTVPVGTAFYIVPSLNPDGYIHSWTSDRMWRKNRRNNGSGVFGVDLNRNFSKGWGLNSGSSGTPSSATYRGPSAFSEPETNGLRAFLDTIPPVAAHIDFHSYGQYVLWSWGYTTALAPGDSWLRATGLQMKQSIFDEHGMNYTAGPTSTTLYMVSGKGPDYTYDRSNAAAYTIELRDTGQNGFLLPENQIIPTQEEAWEGFAKLVQRMLLR